MGLLPRDRNLSRSIEQVELAVRASDFRVPAAEVRIRLDAFLKLRLPWRSRASVQRLIEDGFVLVAPAGADLEPSPEPPRVERRSARQLRNGARVVVVIPPELRLPDVQGDPGALVIRYEDEDALVVDKPAGQAVHPSGRTLTGTLIQDVHARFAQGAELPVPVRLCHRIDKETSGVVLLAKGARAHRQIRKQFERHTIEKEYLALVHGVPAESAGSIELPLGPALAGRVRMKIVVQEGGREARTTWRLLERRGDFALLACAPLTGRQHQIRVHLAAIGHPVVADVQYGGRRPTLGLDRPFLHARRLELVHPFTDEPLAFETPLPADLSDALASLG